jgi:hypothetical protein
MGVRATPNLHGGRGGDPSEPGRARRRSALARRGGYLAVSRCPGTTPLGSPCKANVRRGQRWCRWHNPTRKGRARHRAESARGGTSKAYGALAAAPSIADVLDVDALNLETPAGLRGLLAGAVRQLARLPLDVRVANALAQVATAQRGIIEASELARRVEALEAAALRRISQPVR